MIHYTFLYKSSFLYKYITGKSSKYMIRQIEKFVKHVSLEFYCLRKFFYTNIMTKFYFFYTLGSRWFKTIK